MGLGAAFGGAAGLGGALGGGDFGGAVVDEDDVPEEGGLLVDAPEPDLALLALDCVAWLEGLYPRFGPLDLACPVVGGLGAVGCLGACGCVVGELATELVVPEDDVDC